MEVECELVEPVELVKLVEMLQEAQDSNALLEDSVAGLMSEMEKLQQERLSILQQAEWSCFVLEFFGRCGWFFSMFLNVFDAFLQHLC